jgi:tetratricopeptide (TPR) repeat protein
MAARRGREEQRVSRRNNGEPRTVLEQKIWERGETLTEFVDYAERFARQTGERGTLSERNLKRLTAGRKSDGTPIGHPRAATARLLERIFGTSVAKLLAPPEPATTEPETDTEREFRQMLSASRRIDSSVLSLLQEQLDATRRLDRQLGAIAVHDEVTTKARQITRLLSHSLTPATREKLAALLSELSTLAGWQALDLGKFAKAWQHYEHAKSAAKESGSAAFDAHTAAEQAFVLLDLGEADAAVEQLDQTRRRAENTTSRLLRAWLAAAHGEALAAQGQRSPSLRAFDQAAALVPPEPSPEAEPYLVLDEIHLARWRGHALARIGDPEAVTVLTSTLKHLDPTFTRAEAGLRVDLATAFISRNEPEQAHAHIELARYLAKGIGSARQQRRIGRLTATL